MIRLNELINDLANQELFKCFPGFSEVAMAGPTRVQKRQGHSNAWSRLDRVLIRAPEADVGDAQPSARPLHESRLIASSL